MKNLSNRNLIDAVVEGKTFHCKAVKAVKSYSYVPAEDKRAYVETRTEQLVPLNDMVKDLRSFRNHGWEINIEDPKPVKVIALKRENREVA